MRDLTQGALIDVSIGYGTVDISSAGLSSAVYMLCVSCDADSRFSMITIIMQGLKTSGENRQCKQFPPSSQKCGLNEA